MGKAERTKQFIIEQAAPLFNKQGIAGTTVDDVLKAAKVARGCLYNHFENKDVLAHETVDYLLQKTSTKIDAVVSKGKTSKEKLHAYLDYSNNPLDTYLEGGCPIFNLAVEADDNNPIVKKKVFAIISGGRQLFSSIVKDGIKNGEYSKKLDADGFAFKLFASVEGAILMCRILDSNEPMQILIKSLKGELKSYEL